MNTTTTGRFGPRWCRRLALVAGLAAGVVAGLAGCAQASPGPVPAGAEQGFRVDVTVH